MRILGIDPGTAIVGWAIVDRDREQHHLTAVAYSTITTSKDEADAERLVQVFDGLTTIITQYRPTHAAIERLFFGTNVKTAVTVGQARGVILLALAQHNIPFVEIAPTQVKEAITGYGRANKQQMQDMVKRTLSLPKVPKPDDVADALAVAIAGVEHIRVQRLLSSR